MCVMPPAAGVGLVVALAALAAVAAVPLDQAATATPSGQRSPWEIILDQRARRRRASLLRHAPQLAPQGDGPVDCAPGCSLQKLCLRPPCNGRPECVDDPDAEPGLWNGWGTSLRSTQPCPDDMEAELCASAGGKVCHDAEGISHEEEEDKKKPKLILGECKSIAKDVTDQWCMKAFRRYPEKAADSDSCRCGAKAPAPPAPPSPSCDESLFGGKPSCLSVSGAHDEWCQETCTSCETCPLSECRCGPEEAAEIALRVRDAVHVCDFEAMACGEKYANGVPSLCKSCADHINDCMVIPRIDEEGTQIQPLDLCLQEVATQEKCRTCNTTESANAFKVRYWPQLAGMIRVPNAQHQNQRRGPTYQTRPTQHEGPKYQARQRRGPKY